MKERKENMRGGRRKRGRGKKRRGRRNNKEMRVILFLCPKAVNTGNRTWLTTNNGLWSAFEQHRIMTSRTLHGFKTQPPHLEAL